MKVIDKMSIELMAPNDVLTVAWPLILKPGTGDSKISTLLMKLGRETFAMY